jgi:hypothetical protein
MWNRAIGRTRWLWVWALLGVLFVPQTFATLVAVYGNTGAPSDGFANRVKNLGYSTVYWKTSSQVTSASLAGVDVLYVYSEGAPSLATQASAISDWVSQGNGLIVEQPNTEGPIAILPSGLGISVWSHFYDPVRNVAITSQGATHPITAGLTSADLCDNFDRVRLSDVAPGYAILGVQASNPSYVALAAAWYGSGRIVFHTGNASPGSMSPGSDRYLHQMIDWAAVPEPAT